MKVSIGCRLGSASPPHPSPSEKIWGQGKRALWTKRLHQSPVVVVERSTKLLSVKIRIGSSLDIWYESRLLIGWVNSGCLPIGRRYRKTFSAVDKGS